MNSFDNNDWAGSVDGSDTTPLISVIVPIYNVEKYVRKCLDSLKNQTMKQIEVICIDDGSTDESGRIADEYVEENGWPRFRVFHTENRGLSAARNRGIDESHADWLMFVDSDDWVDIRFCVIPYEAALENQAELVIFNRLFASQSGRIKRNKENIIISRTINHETAIDVGSVVVWNKIYKKSLFSNIRFPEGHVFEEVATTHKLIARAERIVWISRYLYYYRYRKGSITHLPIGNDDLLIMSKQRYEELLKLGYPKEKAYSQLLGSALRYCGKAQNRDNSLYLESVSIIERGSSVYLNRMDRIKKLIFCFDKNLYRFLYRLAVRVKDLI